jgi:hypothetical protein
VIYHLLIFGCLVSGAHVHVLSDFQVKLNICIVFATRVAKLPIVVGVAGPWQNLQNVVQITVQLCIDPVVQRDEPRWQISLASALHKIRELIVGTTMILLWWSLGIAHDLTLILFYVTQSIAEVQLPAVTHRVYLDVEIDGQHIGISQLIHPSLGVSMENFSH